MLRILELEEGHMAALDLRESSLEEMANVGGCEGVYNK